MTEAFLGMSAAERSEALQVAASTSGRPLHVLEKDVWVVWTLSALFESDFGKHLVFKGGTSLSKAYKAIERFSEDIDVTYDIRVIAEDLVEDTSGDEPPPPTKTQGKNGQTRSENDFRCGSMKPYYLISSANWKRWS